MITRSPVRLRATKLGDAGHPGLRLVHSVRRHGNQTMTSADLHLSSRCLIVAACLAFTFSALGECRGPLQLLPDNPSGLVGEDMHLNCTLSDETLSWQDLVFSMVYYSDSEHHRIPATNVRNLSDSSVEVTLRNLTDKHHLAIVFCRYPNQFTDSQIITVGRPPAVPKIDYYRYLDWKEFVFRWKVRPATNGFETKYIAWFKNTNHSEFRSCHSTRCYAQDKSKCPKQYDNTCHIPEEFLELSKNGGYLYFKVNASNIAGSATSDTISALLYMFIEPGPITKLHVSSKRVSEVGRFVDVLSYLPPRQLEFFIYEILLISTENSRDQRQIFKRDGYQRKRKMNNITLENLTPFTVYNLSIRSKVVEYYERKKDIWSKWSNVTFTSHEEVPTKSPDVCRCCFEVDEDSLERTALIYFQPLTKEESRGKVSYDVKYKPTIVKRFAIPSSYDDTQRNLNVSDADSETSFFLNQTNLAVNESTTFERTRKVHWDELEAAFIRLNLSKSVQYRVNLHAKTKAGYSPTESTTVFIPTQLELFQSPANCSVMSVDGIDKNRVVFRWNSTPSVSGHDLKYVTVFWCKAFLNSMRCQEPLNWMELAAAVASVDIYLADSYEGYLFGIGQVLNNGYSSGIRWTCSYFKKDAVASPPHLIPLEIDETQVVIKLDKPNYNPREGLVYGFNLYYSPVDYEDRLEETKIYIEDRNTRGIVAVEGLKRGTTYKFKAEALTAAGPSYINASIIVVTRPFQLTEHTLVWLIFGAVVTGIFALVGLGCCIRWPHEKCIKLRRWIKEFEPCMPPVVLDEHMEKEDDSMHPTYSLLSGSATFNNSVNQQMEEQMEEDQRESARRNNRSEDSVQPYSRITARPVNCRRKGHLSQEVGTLEIGFSLPDRVSIHEHVLPPLLEQVIDKPICDQLLPLLSNFVANSEQFDSSVNDTTVSSDDAHISSSNSYLPLRTVDNNILSLTSHEQINDASQYATDDALPGTSQLLDCHVVKHAFLEYHTSASQQANQNLTNQQANQNFTNQQANQNLTNQQANQNLTNQQANQNLRNHVLPLPSEFCSLEMTCQIFPATSQHFRNERSDELSELSQNFNESLAERILPTSGQLMKANVANADHSSIVKTGLVLRPTDRSTVDRSDFESLPVDLLSGQLIADDNRNSRKPPLQRILPKLLELGQESNSQTETDNFTRLPNKPIQTMQKEDGPSTSGAVRDPDKPLISCSTAEVHGQHEQSQFVVRVNYSSSPSSTATDETVSTSEGNFTSRRAKRFDTSGLDDDEGIYL